MTKANQPTVPFSQRVKRPFAAVGRALRGSLAVFTCAAWSGEIGRAAGAGAILFGFAAAALGAQGAFEHKSDGTTATGALMRIGWGYDWAAYAAFGVVAGAAFGALVAWASRRFFPARAALAVLVIGAVGGVAAGGTWGSAVARERVLDLRAQHVSAPVPSATTLSAGQKFTRVNGGVRLTGSVGRNVNPVLMGFMLLTGTVVGVLAARGLAAPTQGPVAGPQGGFPVQQPNRKQ